MKNIKIYTINSCHFCKDAIQLLKSKGIKFEEINISENEFYMLNELAKTSGIHTLPQIFAGTKFIGGCNDIYQLESQNKLDEALS